MNIYEVIKGSKVLIQLSGGKDSVACLHMLKNNGINCSAVHFVHKWSYSLPTDEAVSKCRSMGVELKIIDITKEISEVLTNGIYGRPCRHCKAVMDKMTAEYAEEIGADYICTGDSRSDKTLFNRLEGVRDVKDLYINSYFNKSVRLPENIKILRLLAEMDNDMVFSYLKEHGIQVRRVGDTGDKYFEYSREGCPLQFKDYGAGYTTELMNDLKEINEKCAAYASELGIKASVHLPSRFIVTIPQGYEEKIRNHLGIEATATVDPPQLYSYVINIALYDGLIQNKDIIREMLMRFCERLSVKAEETGNLCFRFDDGSVSAEMIVSGFLTVSMITANRISEENIRNIIIEMFHTNNVVVCESVVKGNKGE